MNAHAGRDVLLIPCHWFQKCLKNGSKNIPRSQGVHAESEKSWSRLPTIFFDWDLREQGSTVVWVAGEGSEGMAQKDWYCLKTKTSVEKQGSGSRIEDCSWKQGQGVAHLRSLPWV